MLFASRLRSIAGDVEPALQISEMARFDQVASAGARTMTLLLWSFLALASVVVLLSLTGIYAVFSFSASQRTRGGHSRRAGRKGTTRDRSSVPPPIDANRAGYRDRIADRRRLSEGDMVRVIALYGCVVIAVSVLATRGPGRRR